MTSSAHVAVIGAGSWGTALAAVLAGAGHRVTLWCREPTVADAINRERANTAFLPGAALPEGIRATADLAAAVAAARDLVVWVVPSQFSRRVLAEAAPALAAGVPVVSATKGIEVETLLPVTGVFEEILGPGVRDRLAVLSGPSFAREVVQGAPTAVAVAAWQAEVAERVQSLFGTSMFRVYTNDDPLGTQIGGALKNVVAIAAGAVEGLGFGSNTQSVLITRGLAEITRLGVRLGANPATFAGLAGMGDLVLTCTGGLSRNRQVGIALGRGGKLEAILGEMRMVAEGVKTTQAAWRLAQKSGVEMPIVEQVHRVLFEGATAREALSALMGRPQRSEDAFLSGGGHGPQR
ncbi:MAG: NAD(P)-dependent glycerol-3-phosphate dehydrogenase [Nitrospirota bacterium]|nr:NAD(P)-dependent glycerol-3-phosphate dehydrogenase [Nitrospirota bacterium]